MNNWLHKYLYKREYSDSVGGMLREEYECGKKLKEQDLKTRHGKALADYAESLQKIIGHNGVQLITISRPSVYGEYEPYTIIGSREEFQERVLEM